MLHASVTFHLKSSKWKSRTQCSLEDPGVAIGPPPATGGGHPRVVLGWRAAIPSGWGRPGHSQKGGCHAPVLGYKGNANLSAKNKHFK
jgi:hypothetical protein